MISIVTGTLNRCHLLGNLIKNTIDSNDKLELVLVDGGSSDGTLEYIKKLNHPRIKLIEVGERSSYPHFMNLGIQNATYDWVCQWNDDVLLSNSWDEVIRELDDEYMFYLFNWKYGSLESLNNQDWLLGNDSSHENKGFCLSDSYDICGDVIMNYGIYNKKVFREIGMYNTAYSYYYADGDMSLRAYLFGYKYKALKDIKVCTLNNVDKVAIQTHESVYIYNSFKQYYKKSLESEYIKKLA